MRFPLITSIPPRLFRLDESGVDVGQAYQEECIASWDREAFDAFSVNSAAEDIRSNIPIIRVNRDASQITGRPHIFISDLLSVGAEKAQNGRFAIANADVIAKPSLVDAVAKLQPGELLLCRRIDVERGGQMEGRPYYVGFDFFAMNVADVAGLTDGQMVFGAPWWDHYLPLQMYMRGCKLRMLEPSVIHLVHEERWDWSVWTALGRGFLDEIGQSAMDPTYRSRLEMARKGECEWSWWRRLRHGKLWNKGAGKIDDVLHRVSGMNVQFIDEHAVAS